MMRVKFDPGSHYMERVTILYRHIHVLVCDWCINEPVSFSSLSTPGIHATTGPVYSTSVGVLKARYMQREGDDSVSPGKRSQRLAGETLTRGG